MAFKRDDHVRAITNEVFDHLQRSGDIRGGLKSPSSCCFERADAAVCALLKEFTEALLIGFKKQMGHSKTKRDFAKAIDKFAKEAGVAI